VHYPVTTSPDEWANEILHLDQLIVEGFNKKTLRQKAEDFGLEVKPEWGSLIVAQECLVGLGYDEDDAKNIISPLRQLNHLRTKLKGHTPGTEAETIKKQTLKEYRTYKEHFKNLFAQCDESIEELTNAFQSF
jgi:hypothetical protein